MSRKQNSFKVPTLGGTLYSCQQSNKETNSYEYSQKKSVKNVEQSTCDRNWWVLLLGCGGPIEFERNSPFLCSGIFQMFGHLRWLNGDMSDQTVVDHLSILSREKLCEVVLRQIDKATFIRNKFPEFISHLSLRYRPSFRLEESSASKEGRRCCWRLLNILDSFLQTNLNYSHLVSFHGKTQLADVPETQIQLNYAPDFGLQPFRVPLSELLFSNNQPGTWQTQLHQCQQWRPSGFIYIFSSQKWRTKMPKGCAHFLCCKFPTIRFQGCFAANAGSFRILGTPSWPERWTA